MERVGLMDRVLCQVIAKLRLWFLVKSVFFFFKFFFTFIELVQGLCSLSYNLSLPAAQNESFHMFQFMSFPSLGTVEYLNSQWPALQLEWLALIIDIALIASSHRKVRVRFLVKPEFFQVHFQLRCSFSCKDHVHFEDHWIVYMKVFMAKELR